MSTLKVPITTITEIIPHSNAERLSIAKVLGYEVIIQKDTFKTGDIVIYVPDGAVLSEWLENLLFEPGSKIVLHNRRIKAIKIRGVLSQGMLINPYDPAINVKLSETMKYQIEDAVDRDVAEYLGITKYSPPQKSLPGIMQVNPNANPYKVKEFREYTDVEHGKYYDRVLQDNEMVIITQKLHGTSARYGYFKKPVISILDKALNLFGLLPEWQFCWGSRRCQIQSKPGKTHGGFKSESQGCDFGDVYTKIAVQEKLRQIIPKGYAVYGEIVGWGIQKGYLYNCGKDQHKFYVYDVMENGKWLDYNDRLDFCLTYNLEMCPELYVGPYSKTIVEELLTVNKISKEPNEGVVVEPLIGRNSPACGRIKLKWLNPTYLLREQSEFQ